MTSTQQTKWLVWVTALILIMACVPSLSTESIPTVNPGAIDTVIVQTANAAASRTAAAQPSPTWTPTIVPTRSTATPTPTVTSTVIFLFSSPSPFVAGTFPPSGSRSDPYACQVTRVSPPNGSVFAPREDFNAFWAVRNIGKRKWDRTSVDYAFAGGDKMHKISSYDLSDNVTSGKTLDLGVDMQAPKDPGTYTTTWTMRAGDKTFCPLELTIVVQEQAAETQTPTTQTAAP
jgi:hypothetical protein